MGSGSNWIVFFHSLDYTHVATHTCVCVCVCVDLNLIEMGQDQSGFPSLISFSLLFARGQIKVGLVPSNVPLLDPCPAFYRILALIWRIMSWLEACFCCSALTGRQVNNLDPVTASREKRVKQLISLGHKTRTRLLWPTAICGQGCHHRFASKAWHTVFVPPLNHN